MHTNTKQSGSRDGSIRIFDTNSRNIVHTEQNLHRKGSSVTSLSIVEQQNRYLITSGGQDGIVWLIFVRKRQDVDLSNKDEDLKMGEFQEMQFLYKKHLRGHKSAITYVASNAFTTLTSCEDGMHKIWQNDGNHIGRCLCTLSETKYHGKVTLAKLSLNRITLGHSSGLISVFRWGFSSSKHQNDADSNQEKKKYPRVKKRSTAAVRKAGSHRRWRRDLQARCNDYEYDYDEFRNF